MRTHMLVSMGAALFVLVPQQAGVPDADIVRVIQGIVAGIGFLGAGAIVKGSVEEDVKGLTTAAGIWMTAAIGIAIGLGREATALLSTLLALLVLGIVPHLVERTLPEDPQDSDEPDEAPRGRRRRAAGGDSPPDAPGTTATVEVGAPAPHARRDGPR